MKLARTLEATRRRGRPRMYTSHPMCLTAPAAPAASSTPPATMNRGIRPLSDWQRNLLLLNAVATYSTALLAPAAALAAVAWARRDDAVAAWLDEGGRSTAVTVGATALFGLLLLWLVRRDPSFDAQRWVQLGLLILALALTGSAFAEMLTADGPNRVAPLRLLAVVLPAAALLMLGVNLLHVGDVANRILPAQKSLSPLPSSAFRGSSARSATPQRTAKNGGVTEAWAENMSFDS